MPAEATNSTQSGGDTSARLLRAACELVGGEEQLARRLNMSNVLLRKYIARGEELPPHLLLRTVDLLLAERDSQSSLEASGLQGAMKDGDDAQPA